MSTVIDMGSLSLEEGDKLITVKEAAEMLSVSERTIARQVDKKVIPAYKIGKSLRLKRSEVLSSVETK